MGAFEGAKNFFISFAPFFPLRLCVKPYAAQILKLRVKLARLRATRGNTGASQGFSPLIYSPNELNLE
jgi:hypothetical protein